MTERQHIETAAARTFDQRALAAIEGKSIEDQMHLLSVYVDQGEADQQAGYGPTDDQLNIVRRRYIAIASDVYRSSEAYRGRRAG